MAERYALQITDIFVGQLIAISALVGQLFGQVSSQERSDLRRVGIRRSLRGWGMDAGAKKEDTVSFPHQSDQFLMGSVDRRSNCIHDLSSSLVRKMRLGSCCITRQATRCSPMPKSPLRPSR